MEQSISSGQPRRMQGALMIVGAVAVGVGSGVVLNVFRPAHQDPLSAAEHTQQEQRAEAQSSAPPEALSAPVAEESVTESASTPVEANDSIAMPPEQETAQSFEAGEPSDPTTSIDDAVAMESEVSESETPATVEHQEAPRTTASVASTSHASRGTPPPAAQVLRPWWNATSADPFGVQYVGQVEGQRAVAVLFSGDIGNASTLGSALTLVDESGKTISGDWKVGNNPRLIVHSDLKPGRYTLAIDAQLASASGQNLRTPLRGPVYIQ